MENLTLKDLAIDHDYYCSDTNYYSNQASLNYRNFSSFYEEFGEADIDMNLVFRWDLKKHDNKSYYLNIYIIQQRRGIFTPVFIDYFEEKDIPLFIKYLKPHIKKLRKNWEPFNFNE